MKPARLSAGLIDAGSTVFSSSSAWTRTSVPCGIIGKAREYDGATAYDVAANSSKFRACAAQIDATQTGGGLS